MVFYLHTLTVHLFGSTGAFTALAFNLWGERLRAGRCVSKESDV